jgi:hypothetical protein
LLVKFIEKNSNKDCKCWKNIKNNKNKEYKCLKILYKNLNSYTITHFLIYHLSLYSLLSSCQVTSCLTYVKHRHVCDTHDTRPLRLKFFKNTVKSTHLSTHYGRINQMNIGTIHLGRVTKVTWSLAWFLFSGVKILPCYSNSTFWTKSPFQSMRTS